MAGWTEHHPGPGREPAGRMRRQIVWPQISFRFHDPADAFDAGGNMDKIFPEEFPGDEAGVPIVKGARQLLHCELKRGCIMPVRPTFLQQEFFGFKALSVASPMLFKKYENEFIL